VNSPATPSDGPGDKPHVLVVDDDKAVRESLRRSLEFNGYQVALAGDGAEALAGIANHGPDVVVMDVMMPRLDGIEATKALRAAGKSPVSWRYDQYINKYSAMVVTSTKMIDGKADVLKKFVAALVRGVDPGKILHLCSIPPKSASASAWPTRAGAS
jgi:CheY-like chemotaxis protein